MRENHKVSQAGQPLLLPPVRTQGSILLVCLSFKQAGGESLGEVGVAAAKQKEWLSLEEFQEVVFSPRNLHG